MASGCKDTKEKSSNTIENQSGRDKPLNWSRSRAIQEAITTANKPGDPVTITFGSVELRLSDVQLLHGPRSINETIIAFYYSFLQSERYRTNSDMCFVPLDTVQCMVGMDADEMEPLYSMYDLDRKLFGFFVFSDEHGEVVKANRSLNHFSMVVFSRPDKAFYYYDSCSQNSKTASKQVQEFVKELSTLMNCRQWQLKAIRANVILNTGYDCGIRILCQTDNVANHVNRFERIEGIEPLHQDSVSAKRTEMLKLIYMHGGKITL